MHALIRAVNFVENHNDTVSKFQSAGEYKTCLGHRAFRRVHQKNHTVHHFENAFDFPAEVGVSGGIDNVDFGISVTDGGIFCKNGNTAFPFKVTGIQYTFHNFLIFALPEHFIHQRGFTVIHVGDNGNVAQMFILHNKESLLFVKLPE